MIDEIIGSLFLDPQTEKPACHCSRCGGACYAPSLICSRCERDAP